ncbi:MAG: DsbA family protein [Nitrospinae bacterium]|nr:DsbA family protein [Nitrospinota bacterium]
MRLRTIEERFGDRLVIERRSFALRPSPDPTVTFKGTYREQAWQRAARLAAPDGVQFEMWKRDDFPTWSIPALAAAKCASFQGKELYDRMHYALFEALFTQGKNIANRDEIIEVAREVGLDIDRFLADYERGEGQKRAIEEYEEAVNRFMVTAVPTVFFDQARVVGAVPLGDYLQVLERLGIR